MNTTVTENNLLLNNIRKILGSGVEKRDIPTLLGTAEARINSIICGEKVNHPIGLHRRAELLVKHFITGEK